MATGHYISNRRVGSELDADLLTIELFGNDATLDVTQEPARVEVNLHGEVNLDAFSGITRPQFDEKPLDWSRLPAPEKNKNTAKNNLEPKAETKKPGRLRRLANAVGHSAAKLSVKLRPTTETRPAQHQEKLKPPKTHKVGRRLGAIALTAMLAVGAGSQILPDNSSSAELGDLTNKVVQIQEDQQQISPDVAAAIASPEFARMVENPAAFAQYMDASSTAN